MRSTNNEASYWAILSNLLFRPFPEVHISFSALHWLTVQCVERNAHTFAFPFAFWLLLHWLHTIKEKGWYERWSGKDVKGVVVGCWTTFLWRMKNLSRAVRSDEASQSKTGGATSLWFKTWWIADMRMRLEEGQMLYVANWRVTVIMFLRHGVI